MNIEQCWKLNHVLKLRWSDQNHMPHNPPASPPVHVVIPSVPTVNGECPLSDVTASSPVSVKQSSNAN